MLRSTQILLIPPFVLLNLIIFATCLILPQSYISFAYPVEDPYVLHPKPFLGRKFSILPSGKKRVLRRWESICSRVIEKIKQEYMWKVCHKHIPKGFWFGSRDCKHYFNRVVVCLWYLLTMWNARMQKVGVVVPFEPLEIYSKCSFLVFHSSLWGHGFVGKICEKVTAWIFATIIMN